MTTYLTKPFPNAKPPGTAADADCQLTREVQGLARVFLRRPWRHQAAPLVRLRATLTRHELWQMRETFPRDFHTRDLLAAAERLAAQLYGASGTRKGKKSRQR